MDLHLNEYSSATVISLGFGISIITIAFYRVYFSPASRFLGSKLTSLTGWVETYYDVFKGGQFTFKTQDWHRQYGPIVRINPTELSISDPTFYDIAYGTSTKYDRLKAWRDRFGIPKSLPSTVEHDLHHSRRSALNPYFSKRSISNITPLIQRSVDQLCDKLLSESAGQRPVKMDDAYAALAADVIFQYCFGWSDGFLDAPNFYSPFLAAINQTAVMIHFATHFTWVMKFMQALPQALVRVIAPDVMPILEWQNRIRSHVSKVVEDKHSDNAEIIAYGTIFTAMMESDLPPREKSISHLHDEAVALVGAGIETTKTAMTIATYWVLATPKIRERLMQELESHFLDPTYAPTWSELERLPYLTAIIQETLRFTHGTAQRSPRISHQPISHNDQIIPAGTPFSTSNYLIHTNPDLFPDPHSFRPERWLNSPRVNLKSTDGDSAPSKPLTHYLVAFSRGPRNCIGQQLAWAELYITLSMVMRRFGTRMQLFETGEEAVRMEREFMVPFPKEGTNGVRIKLEGVPESRK